MCVCVSLFLAASPASVTLPPGAAQDEAARRNAPPKAKGKGKKSDSGQSTDNDLEVETMWCHPSLNAFRIPVCFEPHFISPVFLSESSCGIWMKPSSFSTLFSRGRLHKSSARYRKYAKGGEILNTRRWLWICNIRGIYTYSTAYTVLPFCG